MLYQTLRQLFPIPRSLTGNGVRQTLKILQEHIPLKLEEMPSGTRCFDWEVPSEWNVDEAYIECPDGSRIADFRENNLHLVGYSIPYEGKLTLSELQQHLYSLPDQPQAIPYITSYYSPRWGFCLSHVQRERLKEGSYRAVIRSTLEPGSLTLGSLAIPGDSSQELLFSTYICHPSMANNELSGPVVAAFLAKALLARERRRYSYRFLFLPETIGSIAYLSRHLDELKNNVIGGYVLSCLGDRGGFSYLSTRLDHTPTDWFAQSVLKGAKIYTWLDRGSDERQFNWPGVDLPIGVITRSKFAAYPEYHTSLDNLDFVDEKALEESLDRVLEIVDCWETRQVYKATTLCEPQLGKRGLYPTLSTATSGMSARRLIDILSYCDGRMSADQIEALLGQPVKDSIHQLIEQGLLDECE